MDRVPGQDWTKYKNKRICVIDLKEAREMDERGFWKDSRGAYAAALAAIEAQPEPDQLDLAECLWLAGRNHKRTGHFADAEQSFIRSLATYAAAGLSEKPESCHALNECAQLYLLLFQFAAAEQLLDKAMTIQTEQLPTNHPDLAMTLHNRAKLTYLKGEPLVAIKLLDQALVMKRLTLGENHTDTGESLEVLGFLLRNAGRLDEAEATLFSCLELQEAALGPEHPIVASNLVSLAELLHHRKKYSRIESLMQRACRIIETRIGEESNAYASAMNTLAMYHVRQGHLNEAAVFAERSLAIAEKIFGPEHTMLSSLVNNLAVLYRALGREKECHATNERAKALLQMRLAKTEGSSLQALILLADKLSLDKEFADALVMLDRALAVASQQHGEKSLKVGEVLHSKAAVYFNLQDWPAAEDCYVQEIAIMETQLSDSCLELALPLRMLAAARLKQGDKPMFESLRNRARAIEQKHGMEDYALVVMKREFESLKSRVGKDHPSVTDKHREMAMIQQQHGDDEAAAQNLEAYTHRRAREYKPNGSEFLKDLISSVLTIQINSGKKEEAVKVLATATETLQAENMKMDLIATFFLLQAQLMTEEWPPALDTARTLPSLCVPSEKAKVIEIIKQTIIKNATSLEEYGHQAEADEMRTIAQLLHPS